MGVMEESNMGEKGQERGGGAVREMEDLETGEKGTRQKRGRVGEGVEYG